MAFAYPIHLGSLIVKVIVFAISLCVGVLLIDQSRFVASALEVARVDEVVEEGFSISDKRDLKHLRDLFLVAGVTCVVVAALVLGSFVGLLLLMVGDKSVRRLPGLGAFRRMLEDDIVGWTDPGLLEDAGLDRPKVKSGRWVVRCKPAEATP